jgi:hypothetical protein
MSVSVSSSTVMAPLWEAAETSSPPPTVRVREAGLFLSFHLTVDAAGARAEEVTFVAFHPVDETCFVFGTSSGKAYGVSLQDNKLFLLADLGTGPLRCGIFCPGYLTSPIVAVVKAANRLVFVDWQRGTVVQETVVTAHAQPILCLVTGPSTESLFCALSADGFTCWEPVGNGVVSDADQRRGTTAAQPTNTAATAASAKAEVKAAASSRGSLYVCTSSAKPSQCTLQQVQGSNERKAGQRVGKAGHRFLGLHVVDPSLLLSVESNNIVSLWSRLVESVNAAAEPGLRSDGVRTERETTTDFAATQTRAVLHLRASVSAPSTLRVRCSTQCGALIALGADAVTTTSKRGPAVEPVVAFVEARTLAGKSVVRLPYSTSHGAATTGDARDASKTAATVVQVSALHDDLVACLLSTGVVHVVLSSTFHLVFSLHPPTLSVSSLDTNTAARVSSKAPLPQGTRLCFTPSGPTFAAMYREQTLALLHLPTARREAVAEESGRVTANQPIAMTVRRWDNTTHGGSVSAVQNNSVSNSSVRISSRQRNPLLTAPHGAAASQSSLTLALPFLRHRPDSKSSTVTAAGAATSTGRGADSSATSSPTDLTEDMRGVEAALSVLATCRLPPPVSQKGFPMRWADVNLVNVRFSDADEVPAGDAAKEKGGDAVSSTTSSSLRASPEEQVVWSEAKFCDTLSAVSCQYNLEHLQAHLMKYGVFPHSYRTLIWRFLMGLPKKSKTASQFAALARRPQHVAVEQLMAPFPLPPNRTRQAVEEALSCLCWAWPVLTLASYLPVLIYPLVILYRNDVQTVVELTLLFFANWGKQFFVCHPRGPTSVLAAIDRELGKLDAVLYQHLRDVGAGVDVWGWELMTSFFTDVLTGPEWLQMMDHACAAAPLWFFAFHVSLIRTRLRAPLIAAVSADQVQRVLRQLPGGSSSRLPLKPVLEDAYRLHGEWMKRIAAGEDAFMKELAPYTHLHTLAASFAYPNGDLLLHDPVILAEKMRELALVQRSREEAAEAAKRYSALRNETEAAAVAEEAFLQQQQARVAAKYDVSTTAWQVQVALERARQAQEAQERHLRWTAVQQRTRNAEEVALLHTEMNTVESQLRHDMVDRHMEQLKWGLATHMTEEELSRMQRAAEEQVERAMRHLQDDAQLQTDELSRFHEEPVLQVDVPAGVAAEDNKAHGAEDNDNPANVNISANSNAKLNKEDSTDASPSADEDGVEVAGAVGCANYSDLLVVKEENLLPDTSALGDDKNRLSRTQDESRVRIPPPTGGHRDAVTSPSAETTGTNIGLLPSSSPARRDITVDDTQREDFLEEIDSNQAAHPKFLSNTYEIIPFRGDGATSVAATQTYVSPPRECQPSHQHRLHSTVRQRVVPAPRHMYSRVRRSSSSSHRTTTTTSGSVVSDPNLQAFVELRNRVLRRLKSTCDEANADGGAYIPRRHEPRTVIASTGSKTATNSCTPTFSSMSYWASNSSTAATMTNPRSASKSTSSSGHRLFDDLPHHRHDTRVEGGVFPAPQRVTRRHSAKPPLHHHPATSSATTITSTLCSTSYTENDSSAYTWSYYDYSTGRSGEGTASVTESFPRTATSSSHSST